MRARRYLGVRVVRAPPVREDRDASHIANDADRGNTS